jgi:hypothetical protein
MTRAAFISSASCNRLRERRHGSRVYSSTTLNFNSVLVQCRVYMGRAGIATAAKLNGHDPWAYLRDVLIRLPPHPNSRIEQLLPHLWQALP